MADTRRVAIALKINQPFPANQEIYAGVQRFARKHSHWKCVIHEQAVELAEREPGSFDGIIARGGGGRRASWQSDVPLVNTRYAAPGDRPDVSSVYIDTQQCGELVAGHLIDRGFQRLAYMVDADLGQADAICKAFADEAEERGRSCSRGYIDTGAQGTHNYWLAARNGLEPFLRSLEPPVAILFAIPWMARLAVTLSEDLGWRVPQDVALICLDNVTTILEHAPEITSIDLNYEQVGYEAAAMLERLMDGRQTEPRQIYVPPRGIIPRESTDHFASEDEVVAATLRFISEHLNQKLTVDRLADHVCVSPRSLQRRFEAALSRPISDEIRRLRLEAAKRLLRDDRMQIGQIARQVGFNSSVTINYVFHRETGMSPSAYRKRLKAERE